MGSLGRWDGSDPIYLLSSSRRPPCKTRQRRNHLRLGTTRHVYSRGRFDVRSTMEYQIRYGDVFKRNEWEWSHYNFHEADVSMWLRHFEDFEKEAKRLIRAGFPIPAYDFVMKASHAFNILDARGVISVTERTGYIGRIRALARQLAETYLKSREDQEFPLLRNHKPALKSSSPTLAAHKWSAEEKEDLLIEIGSEELPATFVPLGMAHFERLMTHFLREKNLAFEEIQSYGTPRRIALLVKGLRGGTATQTIEKKGPSLQSAFESDGTPTKAAGGFFRSLNVEPKTLQQIRHLEIPSVEIRKVNGTDYLFAQVLVEGQSTRSLLAEALPSLILGIDFPKKMRWGSSDIEYARPLRWIVTLYGKEIIPFQVGDISSDRISYGHRFFGNTPISLTTASQYVEQLKNQHVMASVEERKTSILQQLEEVEKTSKGIVVAKERVLPQVLYLVEWPYLTTAAFDPLYLQAPKEVLISEMVEHQKYFPLVNTKEQLLPHFVITCNTPPSDLIRKGNEKALAPRLADGYFLYQEDLKKPLEAYNEKLKGITFQKDLGSMAQKVFRLFSYIPLLHRYLPTVDLKKAERAAHLSKADLATELVGEFPELQGTIGHLYALHSNEDPEVAKALEEQWMPRSEKGSLPQTGVGILLSLADKLDNFFSCFALNVPPTSSSDPYALRRQALGLVKILIHEEIDLPLKDLLEEGFEIFLKNPELSSQTSAFAKENKTKIVSDIYHFISQRLRTVLLDENFEKDEIEAVLSKGQITILEAHQLAHALHEFRELQPVAFSTLLEMTTRARKILSSTLPKEMAAPKSSAWTIDPTFLSHEAEQALFFHLEKLDQLLEEKHPSYLMRFERLSSLGPFVARLFDAVKILDDDTHLRHNRLALLHWAWQLCDQLVDFSKIQEG